MSHYVNVNCGNITHGQNWHNSPRKGSGSAGICRLVALGNQSENTMALTLRVLSGQKEQLGDAHRVIVGPQGTTIGRSRSNDWVLPDEQHLVSGRHASIDFLEGDYYLTDTSSNGVYVNDAEEPVSVGKPQCLCNGDKLTIGKYRIVAEITADEEVKNEAHKEITPDDVESGDENIIKVEAALNAMRERAGAEKNTAADAAIVDESVVQENVAEATGESESMGATGPFDDSDAVNDPAAMLAFFRGLGITGADLDSSSSLELMHNAGQALREFVVGIMEIMQTRAILKNVLRVEQTTIQPGRNNPLKFSANAEDAIRNLLVGHKRQFVPAVETIRQACGDVKRHEEKFASAVKIATDDFTSRLDPDLLQDDFDQSLNSGSVFGGSNKKRYWDLYCERYLATTQRSKDQLPYVFNEQFIKAYENYGRAGAKKGSTSSDRSKRTN